jgi:adenylosuccinate synthase
VKTRAILVAGLGFGDEGKGTVTEFLTRRHRARLVVRYNGGPQALHHVVLDDGTWHGFAQFGSGTLAGARTFLSRHMLVEPWALEREAAVLASKGIYSPLSLLTVQDACVIVTPWHRLANRMREKARGANRHGSCGIGVGEARSDQLNDGIQLTVGQVKAGQGMDSLRRIRDLKIWQAGIRYRKNPDLFELYDKMFEISIREVSESYESTLSAVQTVPELSLDGDECVVFEGAQGVLLDETHGFAPYNSWTDCTFANAKSLLVGMDVQIERVGVIRSYATRHGAGPFPTEDASLHAPEAHNGAHSWMGDFRIGRFDAVLLEYTLRCCCGVDSLAITHMDKRPSNRVATSYSKGGNAVGLGPTSGSTAAECLKGVVPTYEPVDDLPAWLENRFGVPVGLTSYGPRYADKCERHEALAAP